MQGVTLERVIVRMVLIAFFGSGLPLLGLAAMVLRGHRRDARREAAFDQEFQDLVARARREGWIRPAHPE